MKLLNFINAYWTQIIFLFGIIGAFIVFAKSMIEGVKCSLRNDILDIFDKCKEKEIITHYQLEALEYSANLYFKLKGNSFVKAIVNKVKTYKIVD